VTTFVLATHNAHKVEELRRILGERLGPHDLVAYDGPDAIEDADTFEGNALIKARAAFAHTGLPALADDSGIAVDALGGAPGIRSARYAQLSETQPRDDGDNLRLLLANLEGVTDRTARFVCAAALVEADGEVVVRGEWPGVVLEQPAGQGGFGYDPIFRPDGDTRSAAELTPAEKDAASHRFRAFTALVDEVRRRHG
jgi:XTP/dITP diphosphohydrolase